ncbi:hypothetical protein [Azospirillum lipoferum]|uniref:Uncharacterized protein n=1 Tax=Azospirillum lipoferum (strain 4B) TaxID=862719 RepID=G7ZBZ1_AZOL4|nr:hypothetical protein [Azospirillum lipoferum]CBS89008.1 Conserved protein of unknown function [Azospirillum lipoferum 4B]
MSISSVGTHTGITTPAYNHQVNRHQIGRQADEGTPSFADTMTTTSGKAAQSGDAAASKPDFTHMTHKGIFDWMNAKLRSGEMSFEESTTYVSMSVSNIAGSDQLTLDNERQVDFLQRTKDGMDWAQKLGNADLYKRLSTALKTMQDYQDKPDGRSLKA